MRQLEELIVDVEWAIANDLDDRELIPMLENLMQQSAPDSGERLFSTRQLAARIVEHQPWRAAILAKQVLAHRDDDQAWGILGLAHTLLGHYRAAAQAYWRALELAPGSVAYSHNLGHLLDCALDRPGDALRLLASAHRSLPEETEIASSYAHALARSGDRRGAELLIARSLGVDEARARTMVGAWLQTPLR